MTDAIASLVTSLGDFPLDPDAGAAWLWTGGGDRLLWASARAGIGSDPFPADAALVRSFAPLLALAAPDREPIRVHQLALGRAARAPVHTCLCRHVPLRQGGYGLLAVAIGAPARSMAEVRGEASAPRNDDHADQAEAGPDPAPVEEAVPPSPPEDEPAPLAEHASIVDAAESEVAEAAPEPLAEAAVCEPEIVAPEPPAAPEWTLAEPGDRSPIRFVWQTGPDGRFIHISRELAAAVGPGRAMVLGRLWEDFAAETGLEEWEGVAAGFRSQDTWTAPPTLWPVENADLGVPVEMAGLKVLEAGRFDGFRGYGIARIERAVERPRSAAEALAGDAVETEDEAFELLPPRDLRRVARPAESEQAPALSAESESAEPAALVQQAATEAEPEAVAPSVDPLADDAQGSLGLERPASAAAREAAPEDAPRVAADPVAEMPPVDAGAAPAASEPAQSPLSASEREAFREIARALGAMTENLGRQVPAAPGPTRDVRPLEILKRDIVRLAPSDTPAPPIDLESARRDNRSRQQGEAARSASLAALQAAAPALLDAAMAGLLVVQDGRAVFANRPLLDLAGYPDLETLEAEGGPGRLFGRSAGDAPAALGRFDLATRSGEPKPVEASVRPLIWDGAPAALTILRAASEPASAPRQRALEMELRAAQSELRELRSVLDTATDGVILLDGEGLILSLNRSAEALFGYDQNEIAGEKLTILFEADSHAAALDYLDGLKSNGVNSILNDGRDVKGRERHGGAIPLFMTIGRVGEREGGAKFCAVLRDVTHWKKVESDLLEAKRAAEDANAHKSDFLARISHEVRTPLNAIIGFSQVMVSESFGPIGNERYRQYARDIHASGEHVVSLVNDLLDLSKVAAGRLDLSFGSVDVNAVVAGSVAMIQPQANAGKVIVRSQLAPQLPAVVADERSLRQIMLNLLSNAARYTEAGGQVVASTSLSENGEVVIRVSDTGIGMAEEEVRRAMEPFRQIPGPRSGGGTGLGLPLTKALVEANRAAFAIRSEPRKGTMVEVVFPSTRVLAE